MYEEPFDGAVEVSVFIFRQFLTSKLTSRPNSPLC